MEDRDREWWTCCAVLCWGGSGEDVARSRKRKGGKFREGPQGVFERDRGQIIDGQAPNGRKHLDHLGEVTRFVSTTDARSWSVPFRFVDSGEFCLDLLETSVCWPDLTPRRISFDDEFVEGHVASDLKVLDGFEGAAIDADEEIEIHELLHFLHRACERVDHTTTDPGPVFPHQIHKIVSRVSAVQEHWQLRRLGQIKLLLEPFELGVLGTEMKSIIVYPTLSDGRDVWKVLLDQQSQFVQIGITSFFLKQVRRRWMHADRREDVVGKLLAKFEGSDACLETRARGEHANDT